MKYSHLAMTRSEFVKSGMTMDEYLEQVNPLIAENLALQVNNPAYFGMDEREAQEHAETTVISLQVNV